MKYKRECLRLHSYTPQCIIEAPSNVHWKTSLVLCPDMSEADWQNGNLIEEFKMWVILGTSTYCNMVLTHTHLWQNRSSAISGLIVGWVLKVTNSKQLISEVNVSFSLKCNTRGGRTWRHIVATICTLWLHSKGKNHGCKLQESLCGQSHDGRMVCFTKLMPSG